MSYLERGHIPVMHKEVLSYFPDLKDSEPCFALDGTLGSGGHTEALLESYPALRMLGLDRDFDAIERTRGFLAAYSERYLFENVSFGVFAGSPSSVLPAFGEKFEDFSGTFSYILLDLGISSVQLDTAERGFSFRLDGPLDMRMDQSAALTADTVVNSYSFAKLKSVFVRGGVGSRSSALANAVVDARPIGGTHAFAEVCKRIRDKKGQQSESKRVSVPFQAVRIEVNDEFSEIKQFLNAAQELLSPGGRLAVISFHSLEDKFVAKAMRSWCRSEPIERLIPLTEDSRSNKGKLLSPQAILPSEEEFELNSRSRSARMRVFEK